MSIIKKDGIEYIDTGEDGILDLLGPELEKLVEQHNRNKKSNPQVTDTTTPRNSEEPEFPKN